MPGGLERKLLTYFLLIVAAALMIGVEFAVEMGQPQLRSDLWRNIREADGGDSFQSADAAVFAPLMRFRSKIIGMFVVLTIVVAIVLLMFIRNVTTPLQKMVDVAQKINEGDLTQVVDVAASDEIGQLATAINGLTSNIQEIAAFSKHVSSELLEKLSEIEPWLRARDDGGAAEVREHIARLEEDGRALKEFVDSFELLQSASVGTKPPPSLSS